jgi:hypothetical protein
MITIKKLKCGAFRVVHHLSGYNTICYPKLKDALDLCRLRLGKCKEHETDKEPLTIIKVPFINFWIIF